MKTQSKGLGDTVAKITKVTGVDKLVSKIVSNCGCEKRKDWLNKKIPYKVKNCITPELTRGWIDFVSRFDGNTISAEDQSLIRSILLEVFGMSFSPCINCDGSVWIPKLNMITTYMNELKNADSK